MILEEVRKAAGYETSSCKVSWVHDENRERPKPFPEDYSNFGLDRPKLSIGEG